MPPVFNWKGFYSKQRPQPPSQQAVRITRSLSTPKKAPALLMFLILMFLSTFFFSFQSLEKICKNVKRKLRNFHFFHFVFNAADDWSQPWNKLFSLIKCSTRYSEVLLRLYMYNISYIYLYIHTYVLYIQ